MNIKRFAAAAIVLFIFMFVYESLVHGKLLVQLYLETPNLWRGKDQMMAYMPFNLFIMAMLAIWISFFFTRIYKNGGWKNGLRFGLYLGVLSGIQAAGAYFYLPISATLALVWFLIYLIETTVGGLLIGAIYRE